MKIFRATLMALVLTSAGLGATNDVTEPPPMVVTGIIDEMLPNGNFESGRVIWTEYSLHGWDIIGQWPCHRGNWCAWLGGGDNEVAYIEQQVTVPLLSPELRYWHKIGSTDMCHFDYAKVLVDSTVVDIYTLCAQSQTNWVRHWVDLGAYAGQTVTLQIRVETDGGDPSALYVDDVYFEFDDGLIFADGFETGDTSAWSQAVP